MLRIAVYDSGWGGELVADYLTKELKTIEVVRVIDWANAPYETKTESEIVRLAEMNLEAYIGRVDAIVLGGYVVSMAIEQLRKRHPEQVFVGLGVSYERILKTRHYPDQVVVLMDRMVNCPALRQELRQKLVYSTLIMPDCSGWEDLINRGMMTSDVLEAELGWDFWTKAQHNKVRGCKSWAQNKRGDHKNMKRMTIAQQYRLKNDADNCDTITKQGREAILATIARLSKACDDLAVKERARVVVPERKPTDLIRPDVVLLLSTHFWGIREELEEVFGWNVRVLDFRKKLLHDTCSALKLRGVDGGYSKH